MLQFCRSSPVVQEGPSSRETRIFSHPKSSSNTSQLCNQQYLRILEELTIWNKFKAFTRASRSKGLNVMTCPYVAKWKITADGKNVVKMRLTIRVLQEWFAHLHEIYSVFFAQRPHAIVTVSLSQLMSKRRFSRV